MLTLEDVLTRLQAVAGILQVDRLNYTRFADEVLPQTTTYTDLYQLAKELPAAQRWELLAQIEQLPESREVARAGSATWLDLAAGTVLLRQARVAQLPVVRDYVTRWQGEVDHAH